MKKIIILLLIICVGHSSFSQQKTPDMPKMQTDYMKKSKNQKKAAWILLGSGGTIFISGIIFQQKDSEGIEASVSLIGTVVMISSIPFFIASSKNKKKAMSISFKNESAPQLMKTNFVYKPVPSLTFKIGL